MQKKYFRKYSQNVNELNGDLVSKSFRQIDTLPFIRNEYFIGRTAYLEQIRNKFSAGGALTIQAIYGLDGMGKTQLALEYAHDALLNNKYDFICWIDCSNEETIKESCCYFLAKIGETEPLDAISRLNLWLQSNSNWLMVLDDFKKDKLIERLMPKRGKGNIFITTRQNIDIFSSEPTIELVCMDKDEAVEYLIKRTNIDGRANAELIAKRLEFFPLALEQAAAYIYHTNIGSDQFIDLINKHELKLFDSNYAVGSYEKTIHTVWNITFDNLSNNAKALLHCFAYMSPNSVELGWIIEHAHNVKARRNGSNALKGFTVKSVFPSELILTCTDELILIKAKAELMAYSLATPKTNDSFIMNALLQEVIRYCLANDSKFAYLLSMWEVLQTQSENIDMIYNDYRIALSLSQAKPLMQNVRSFWKFRQELSRSLNNVSSHRVDMDLLHFEFQLYSFSAQFLTLNADTDEEIYEEADIYYSKACSLSQLLFGGGENDIVSSTQSFTTIQEKHRRMRVNLVLKRNDIAKKLYEEAKQVLINSARINPGMVKQALTNYSDLWSEFGFPDAADEARKIAVECGVAHGR